MLLLLPWWLAQPPLPLLASAAQVCLVKPGSSQDSTLLSPQGSKAATGLLEHSDKVQQVQMCPLADFTCIVIALGTGMQVWDAAGSQLLFSWALPPTKLVSGLAPVPTFARGIAANIAADGSAQICLGASSGLVYIFDAPRPSSIALVAALQHHTSAVTALGSSWQGRRGNLTNDVTCSLVSSDDGGAVCLWEAASASSYTQRHALMGHGTPCVALAVRGETVVAAFQDGVVRLHDMMSVLFSVCWNNMAITGAVFTGDDDSDNSLVAAAAYDTDTLQLWQLP
eukprot:jgi/Astpho2/2415/fgenesh1_pg.00044_%23_45_t